MKRKALKRGFNPIINQKNYRNELFNSFNHNNFNSDSIHPEDQITEENQKGFNNKIEKNEISLKENEDNGIQPMDNQVKFLFL